MIAEDDRVAVRFRFLGTNTGSFMGTPVSGKPIDVAAHLLQRWLQES